MAIQSEHDRRMARLATVGITPEMIRDHAITSRRAQGLPDQIQEALIITKTVSLIRSTPVALCGMT